MKLQYDPNQGYQADAIAAVVDLFEGQPQGGTDYSVIDLGAWGDAGLFAGQTRSELGVGNARLLPDEMLLANTLRVQLRNDIDAVESSDLACGDAARAQWTIHDPHANEQRLIPHFSVEMETGTGKTYVYLRTIFELSHRYGFTKFIVVVPSVAIREGVLHSIRSMSDHFKSLYDSLPFEHFVYSADNINQIRQFAVSNTLQIMVMNIDAFRRNFEDAETEEDRLKSNVFYRETDRLPGGRSPMEFVQSTRPIVIIDEPQSVVNTDTSKQAIKALNPLCTLRYSATHKEPFNLVYRLDPVRAFELRLVKQIIVGTARAEGDANDAYVRFHAVDRRGGIKAKLQIDVQGASGPARRIVTVRGPADLFALSQERPTYQTGYEITEINAEPGKEFIRFSSGKVLRLGEETGGMQDDVWRVQIKHTVRKHLEKEVQLLGRGIKVLSLFFIDSVANYRTYDEAGRSGPGKFATYFEEVLAEYAKDARFAALPWLKRPASEVHNGYFAADKLKKGQTERILKDSRGEGTTAADNEVYELIMQRKEDLLAESEPLRFIFSHSALREGWDNPNVFQICTLNERASTMTKRQEIGRGLRLPVDHNGQRVFDESVNKLFVMANESYEEFASTLQKEYERDCGVTFGKVPITILAQLERIVDGEPMPVGKATAETVMQALVEQGMVDSAGKLLPAFDPRQPDFKLELPDPIADLAPAVVDVLATYHMERHVRRERDEGTNKLKKEVLLDPAFMALWDKIKPKTMYRVEFQTEELVSRAVSAIKRIHKIEPSRIRVAIGDVNPVRGGVQATAMSVVHETIDTSSRPLPDILAYLQNETELTRSTLVRILKDSGRMPEFFNDPQKFMDSVAKILTHELRRLIVDGIKYERVPGDHPQSEWEMALFKNEELIDYLNSLPVKHSLYEYVEYDSEVERQFAKQLDDREDVKLFVKLPRWFTIDTPVGKYNPDWAIIKHEDETIYLIRETKGAHDVTKLRNAESDKILCGQRHFEALGLPFKVAVSATEV